MSSIDWASYDMLEVRLDMMGEDLVMSTFNNAVKYFARNTRLREQLKGITWLTVGDDRVCTLCAGRENDMWKPGQFMPRLPAHIGCRCSLDVILG